MRFKLSLKILNVRQERRKFKKLEYLDSEKSILSEIKSIFHDLLRDFVWRNIKKYCTEALNIFAKLLLHGCFTGSSISLCNMTIVSEKQKQPPEAFYKESCS